MSDNSDTPDAPEGVRVGRDVSGILVAGDHNSVTRVDVTADYGAQLTVFAGPLPTPVRRHPISHLPRSFAADPLIGRDEDVQRLREAIEAQPLVHLWGPSGIGKSALLRHLALTLPRGSEGVAYIEARGRTADDLAQAIFDISFDAPNYKPSLEVIKEHLKTLHLRIYLDDAGLADHELRRLFDLAPESTFVFTAEQRSSVGGAHAVRLGGLTAAAAAELITTLLNRALRPDEERIVAALRDEVDGNPLRLRRIASSGAEQLPGIDELPELLPALVRGLGAREKDLLHLLASLSGAELTGWHLNDLLGFADAGELADGLVRGGLLVASETGYSCPPDVAEQALAQDAAERYPADRLCERLTAWVLADGTAPDDVAAHFQALDAAVLHAEATGHAALGVALARAASPKLAGSLQFDAWGCLIGAGWAAATAADDRAGREFFVRAEGARNKARGKPALAAMLLAEAAVLWREINVLHAQHAATQTIAGTAATQPVQPVPLGTAPSQAGTASNPAATSHMTTMAHAARNTTATGHASASASASAASPVTNTAQVGHAGQAGHTAQTGQASQTAQTGHAAQSAQASHQAAANTATHVSQQAGVSQTQAATHTATQAATHVGTSSAQSVTQAVQQMQPLHQIGTVAAGGGHTGVAATTAVAAKGVTAMVVACVLGAVAVVGVGAAVYAGDQTHTAASGALPTVGVTTPFVMPTMPAIPQDTDTSIYVDPVCDSLMTSLDSEEESLDTDSNSLDDAVNTYNTAMDAHNSGETSNVPSTGPVNSAVNQFISDLQTMTSTLQTAGSTAQNTGVVTALDGMSSATQKMISGFQSYAADGESAEYDYSSQADQLYDDDTSLADACFGS